MNWCASKSTCFYFLFSCNFLMDGSLSMTSLFWAALLSVQSNTGSSKERILRKCHIPSDRNFMYNKKLFYCFPRHLFSWSKWYRNSKINAVGMDGWQKIHCATWRVCRYKYNKMWVDNDFAWNKLIFWINKSFIGPIGITNNCMEVYFFDSICNNFIPSTSYYQPYWSILKILRSYQEFFFSEAILIDYNILKVTKSVWI